MQQGTQGQDSRLQLDKRVHDGEVLQLSFGKPGEYSGQVEGADASGQVAGTSSSAPRVRPFDGLNAVSASNGQGQGGAKDTSGVFQGPVKKKSKVSWRMQLTMHIIFVTVYYCQLPCLLYCCLACISSHVCVPALGMVCLCTVVSCKHVKALPCTCICDHPPSAALEKSFGTLAGMAY